MRIFRILPAIPFPVSIIMHITKYFQRSKRNIVWRVLPFLRPRAHQNEGIAQGADAALKRCVHRASLEAK